MKTLGKFSSFSFMALFLSSVFFFSRCSKERIEEEPEPELNKYSSVNTYLDSKKQEEQEFIIDTAGTDPIIGNQGTKIWIGKDCLMFPNGDSVTWPFTVKLVELYLAKDMIYYQMPTVASGNILETDGEIRLRAFKDGTELVLRPSPCLSIIEMPNSAPENYMRVFYGFESGGRPDWTDNVASLGVTSALNPAFSATSTGYLDSIARLGWINCGFQIGNGSGSTLSFTSTTDELTNLGIFIYFPATKTVMQVYNTVSGLIPDGSAVKIVVIGVKSGGELFSFSKNLTVSASASIDVIMNATTDSDLTALLDGL